MFNSNCSTFSMPVVPMGYTNGNCNNNGNSWGDDWLALAALALIFGWGNGFFGFGGFGGGMNGMMNPLMWGGFPYGSRSGSRRPSRYGFAYDQYMENRDKHSKSSPEENSKRIELLNDFIEDLEDMAKDVVKGMSPEEKQVWKIKLNKLTSM